MSDLMPYNMVMKTDTTFRAQDMTDQPNLTYDSNFNPIPQTIVTNRYSSSTSKKIPKEIGSKAYKGYISAQKLNQSQSPATDHPQSKGVKRTYLEIFLLQKLNLSTIDISESTRNTNESFFKVFGLFGYFRTHPVFYALDYYQLRTRVHTFIYDRQKNQFVTFRKPRIVELGLCECVA
jgi:hypothetical protein